MSFNLPAVLKKLSVGKCAELQGNRLKVYGDGSGIFFVPVDSEGKSETDESKWIQVPDENIIKKYPKSLIFQIPDTISAESKYLLAGEGMVPNIRMRLSLSHTAGIS